MVALAMLALLPSVFPYDHVLPHLAGHAHGHDAAHAASAHAAHCHGDPGSCSDAPVPSGPGQMVAGEALVVAPVMMLVLVSHQTPLLAGVSRRPEVRPPVRCPCA